MGQADVVQAKIMGQAEVVQATIAGKADVVQVFRLKSWASRTAELVRFYLLQYDINQFSLNYL
jgi:hypothetical protein